MNERHGAMMAWRDTQFSGSPDKQIEGLKMALNELLDYSHELYLKALLSGDPNCELPHPHPDMSDNGLLKARNANLEAGIKAVLAEYDDWKQRSGNKQDAGAFVQLRQLMAG